MFKKKRSDDGSNNEARTPEQPDVIDLRGHDESASTDDAAAVAVGQAYAATAPAPSNGNLSADEWWDWASLTQRITDAQHRARWSSPGAPRLAGEQRTPPPASGQLTPREWATWVDLGQKIAQPTTLAASADDGADDADRDDAEPEDPSATASSAEPDVVDDAEEPAATDTAVEPEPEPDVADDADPDAPEPADTAPDVEPEPAEADDSASEASDAPEPADTAEVEPEIAEEVPPAPAPAAPPAAAATVMTPSKPIVNPAHAPVREPEAAAVNPWRRRAGVMSAAAVGVLVLILGVVVAGQMGQSPAPDDEADSPVLPTASVRWLDANIGARARLLSPQQMVSQLQTALPGRSVVAYSDVGAEPVDLIVVSAELDRLPADAPARAVARRAVPVAEFAAGTVQLREVVGTGGPAATVADRRRVGRELVRRLALRLTPAAWSALTAGQVDAGLMTLLDRLSRQHAVDIADFPVDGSSKNVRAPARTAVITAIDGAPVRSGGAAATKLAEDIRLPSGELPATTSVRQLGGAPALVLLYLLSGHASS